MNCLITTFDGLGDGIIYYTFFKRICEKYPDSLFFITSNILFADSNLSSVLKLPVNLKIIDDSFRKFYKDHWNQIRSFIVKNNINTVINLRVIGRKFEHDYYEFKTQVYNNRLSFYDDETLDESEKLNRNIREILKSLFRKVFGEKIYYDTTILGKLFPLGVHPSYTVINFHSRGVFKLWEPEKWAEVISFLINKNKKVRVFSGFDENEKAYTKKVLNFLPDYIKLDVKIIDQNDLCAVFKNVQNSLLLVSVDSWSIHFADTIGVNVLGIYTTTSPIMWGGVTDRFRYITSNHLFKCKNFYPYFGMCINNKQKCEEIDGIKDDISVSDVLEKIRKIYE